MRIAVRLRRQGYNNKYPDDFTLRYKIKNGIKTEFEKIKKGYGDWFFYGHVEDQNIYKWLLIDLNLFRKQLPNIRNKAGKAWGRKENNDGTSFLWFNYKHLDCIIAKSP